MGKSYFYKRIRRILSHCRGPVQLNKGTTMEDDPHKGIECAYCAEKIGSHEGVSTPSGSMHASCARKHENEKPEDW